MLNEQIILSSRPEGMVSEDNFSHRTSEIPACLEGQFVVEIECISMDPAMRGWMNEGTTYMPGVQIGTVMRALSAGKIIESKHPEYELGSYVSGLFGVQKYAASDGNGVSKITLGEEPLSYHLGILGMPGMTAYFGLLRKGEPKAGETIFISGAAGIVGSTVGQIAKIKGCRVIGSAGSKAKCDYLVNECGFDGAINYKEEDVATRIKEVIPDGMHIYYDNVGGPILDIALANLARGARVVICGAISQYNKKVIYGPHNYMKVVTARGILTGIIVFDYINEYPQAVREMSNWIATGKLKTKEDKKQGIKNFTSTLKMLFTGENFGKLILEI